MRVSIDVGASLIQFLVARNAPHANYDRNTKRAKFWKSIVSGQDQMDIVVSYKPRESEEQKEQRFRLFNSPTPEAAARAIGNYSRLESTDDPIRTIRYEGSANENEATLNALIERFNGDRNLLRYVLDVQKKYIQIDPNAFLVILFDGERDATGAFKSKPKPRPEIVESAEVYDFKLDNGVYSWLCRRQYIPGKKDGREGVWQRYNLYTADYVFEALEINEYNTETQIFERIGGKEYTIFTVRQNNKDVMFALVTYPISSKQQLLESEYEIPFVPLGFEENPDANGYESILAPAESRFRDLINRTSEYALTIALHTFLQKYQYVKTCTHIIPKVGKCEGGRIGSNGDICPACKGTGERLIATVQDTVTMTLPDTKDEFFPISEMVQYIELPFQIVEHLKAEIESLEGKIEAAIWGIDLRKAPDGKMTATEVISRYDTVYVRLSRIESHLAMLWKKCVRLTAKYAEIEKGLQVSYSPRKNYQMETLGELMAAFSEAKVANAPYQVVRSLELSIIKKQGKTTDEQMMWNEAMERFRPFRTKTEVQMSFILSSVSEDDYYRVLWSYFDEIFEQIKNEVPQFYLLPYSGNSTATQTNIVTAYVGKFQEMVRAQQQEAMSSQQALGSPTKDLGDISLAAQRYALAAQRARDAGNTELEATLNEQIRNLVNPISNPQETMINGVL